PRLTPRLLPQPASAPPEGVELSECTCTVSGNTLQIAPLPRPGVFGFLIMPITGIPSRLYVIAFRGDAVEFPRIKFDLYARERPLRDRMLILRGVACEARLDGIDEALADPMWHTRGEIVGAQGSLNLANYGA
ncbi:MAG TPA: hypothetical protein VKP30_10225, partial [Polyangiaceae bacterium]|nr:hypothetical protein [Polyangiaceae bacterium]